MNGNIEDSFCDSVHAVRVFRCVRKPQEEYKKIISLCHNENEGPISDFVVISIITRHEAFWTKSCAIIKIIAHEKRPKKTKNHFVNRENNHTRFSSIISPCRVIMSIVLTKLHRCW